MIYTILILAGAVAYCLTAVEKNVTEFAHKKIQKKYMQ